MNYVTAHSTKFIIDGPDDETVDDVLSNMDCDFLEENLEWVVSDYEPPIIEDSRLADSSHKNVPEVSKKFYKEFSKVEKEIYETDKD